MMASSVPPVADTPALSREHAIAALAIVTSVPLAVMLLPATRFGPLLPALQRDVGGSSDSLAQAVSVTLPVAAAVVAVAALVTQRMRAWILLFGLVMVAIAYGLAAQQVGSVGLLAVTRGLHGLGAGVILAATGALVGEAAPTARRVLSGLWAGVLVASLVAVAPIPSDAGDLSEPLRPFTWLLAVALVAAVLLAVVSRRTGPTTASSDITGVRNPLALLLWTAVAMAIITVVVIEPGSDPGMTAVAVIWLMVAAVVAITARVEETAGTRTAAALPLVALVVGATAFPVASSPVARRMTIELVAGASTLEAIASVRSFTWLPLAAAGAVAMVAAVAAARKGGHRLVAGGLAVAAVGALATLPLDHSIVLITPGLILLGLGAGLALGAAAADAGSSALRVGVGLLASGLAAGTLLAGVIGTWSMQYLTDAAIPTSDGTFQVGTPLAPFVSFLRMWSGNVLAAALLGCTAVIVAVRRRRRTTANT